jgi:hypothetical protein
MAKETNDPQRSAAEGELLHAIYRLVGAAEYMVASVAVAPETNYFWGEGGTRLG